MLPYGCLLEKFWFKIIFCSVHRGKKRFLKTDLTHNISEHIHVFSVLFWPFNSKASNAKCRLKQLRMWRAACSSGLPVVMSLYLWQVSEVLEANLCASIRAPPWQVSQGSPVLKVPATLYFLFVYCISDIECAKNITWIHPSKSGPCVKIDTTIHSLHTDISMSCSETSCPFKARGHLSCHIFSHIDLNKPSIKW